MRIYSDLDTLSRVVAECLVDCAAQAVAERGAFHIALAGGSTPRQLYRTLAEEEFAERMPWSSVHIWFGDERAVPPDHPDSNFRMAHQALLGRVPVPPEQVHPMDAARADLESAAEEYAHRLATEVPSSPGGVPVLDVVLLGLGEDGHTASLFPDTEALHETRRTVVPVFVDSLRALRLTLTYPILNVARRVVFLVSGAAKADVLRRVLAPDPAAVPLPAQRLAPAGDLMWFVDQAAAAALPEAMRHAHTRR